MNFEQDAKLRIIIIGGGIAATTCLKTICGSIAEHLQTVIEIFIICNKAQLKCVKDLKVTGRRLESFNVIDNDVGNIIDEFSVKFNIRFILGTVIHICSNQKLIKYYNQNDTKDIKEMRFNQLCICTGAKPKQFHQKIEHVRLKDRLITIRDADSVIDLKYKLSSVDKLVIIGNGGIGLETVFRIENCHKTWLIKDSSIGTTFFDAGAAKFLLDGYNTSSCFQDSDLNDSQANKSRDTSIDVQGCSLGPNWTLGLPLLGSHVQQSNNLEVIYEDQPKTIIFDDSQKHKVILETCKNVIINCDMIILALGVVPNTNFVDNEIRISEEDHGILIDTGMETSVPDIYAAGDVVSCNDWPITDLWFQMRLWTQARQMGFYAGKCIAAKLDGQDASLYNSFDCFTHVTKFFGKKLVLLGRFKDIFYNSNDHELLVRINPPDDYVKLVIDKASGSIVGAVIVGDSNLDETIENLINDRIDVRNFKERLLDETVDIDDYFD